MHEHGRVMELSWLLVISVSVHISDERKKATRRLRLFPENLWT